MSTLSIDDTLRGVITYASVKDFPVERMHEIRSVYRCARVFWERENPLPRGISPETKYQEVFHDWIKRSEIYAATTARDYVTKELRRIKK